MRYTLATQITASDVWTSTLSVQGLQRLNIGILIGSVIASAGVPKESVVLSTFSGVITLQRQMAGDADGVWRDVQQWSIAAAAKLTAAVEAITSNPEPETCEYRAGCKIGDHYAVGTVNVRLGTS